MAGKVDAYDKTTGRKIPYKVPEKWFGIFPNLRKTPIQKAAEASKASKAASTKEG
ncbi:MAG: hypothetical protein ACTIOA_07325 [Brachybacterium tyrofermentans]|uniref:hypothetical protein n=1 Tax=Brachybacterium TaxID=43668 RepID=UPI000A1B2642|nr:hypothetical protein FM103_13960 [Corynebacterium xerosis]